MMTPDTKVRQTMRAQSLHLDQGGKRQRTGLGYVRSRLPTKPRSKTVTYRGSPRALSCFYDLVCHLFCTEGHRIEFVVDGLPVATFRQFKKVWRPGVPVYGVFASTAVYTYRIDYLPLGRVLGLRGLRRLINSSLSYRSSQTSRKFVYGGLLKPTPVAAPAVSSRSGPFWASLDDVWADPRARGSALEIPAVRKIRELPHRSFGERAPLPDDLVEFTRLSHVFDLYTSNGSTNVPQHPINDVVSRSTLHSSVIGSAIARDLPLRYSKRFTVPSEVSALFGLATDKASGSCSDVAPAPPPADSSTVDPFAVFESRVLAGEFDESGATLDPQSVPDPFAAFEAVASASPPLSPPHLDPFAAFEARALDSDLDSASSSQRDTDPFAVAQSASDPFASFEAASSSSHPSSFPRLDPFAAFEAQALDDDLGSVSSSQPDLDPFAVFERQASGH